MSIHVDRQGNAVEVGVAYQFSPGFKDTSAGIVTQLLPDGDVLLDDPIYGLKGVNIRADRLLRPVLYGWYGPSSIDFRNRILEAGYPEKVFKMPEAPQ